MLFIIKVYDDQGQLCGVLDHIPAPDCKNIVDQMYLYFPTIEVYTEDDNHKVFTLGKPLDVNPNI